MAASGALAPYRWLAAELHGLTANFAQIYFIPSAGIGLLLLAVLVLADRPAALTGLAASAGAWLIALVLRLPRDARRNGLFGYNAALTGIAFGALWQPDFTSAVWLAVCVCLTVIASAELARHRLPALTGPFVGVMALSWAMQPWLGLLPRTGALACDTGTPGFVFCSVGQVVFVAPLVLGLLTWYVLALWNARATVWALAAGVVVWLGIALLAQHWPALAGQAGGIGVNGFLAALGLGVFHRRPGMRVAGAALAGLICVVLGAVLGPLGWPYFTLPFNLAVWTLLAVTRAGRPLTKHALPHNAEASLRP
ncbi:Urea transporter [Pandoraea iniqua]|uniref:Urea transporter n=1 Tax=Pandoraea iniqua TaxID=2508288 RepID=A0A5E4UP77_9BURK|nr:urea transporter [Pandoraea iniqua]VVE01841.1 Urea transporter [Pandoraea iniqua]